MTKSIIPYMGGKYRISRQTLEIKDHLKKKKRMLNYDPTKVKLLDNSNYNFFNLDRVNEQMKLNIAHICKLVDDCLGPGKRYGLWFQGCNFNCKGCINPQFQKNIPNKIIDIEEITNDIIENKNKIEGITIGGGEPFLQIEPLYELCHIIKEKTKLSIIIYTGYTIEELKQLKNPLINKILNTIDMLIDGRYIEELNEGLIWRGSTNQKIHFLSERYNDIKNEILNKKSRNLYFDFNENNELLIYGTPAVEFYEKLKGKLNKEGVNLS